MFRVCIFRCKQRLARVCGKAHRQPRPCIFAVCSEISLFRFGSAFFRDDVFEKEKYSALSRLSDDGKLFFPHPDRHRNFTQLFRPVHCDRRTCLRILYVDLRRQPLHRILRYFRKNHGQHRTGKSFRSDAGRRRGTGAYRRFCRTNDFKRRPANKHAISDHLCDCCRHPRFLLYKYFLSESKSDPRPKL